MMLAGIVLAVVGLAVWGLGKAGFRGLPGDIQYESGNVRFYFPIVTCVLLSLLFTFGMWLWRWFTRH